MTTEGTVVHDPGGARVTAPARCCEHSGSVDDHTFERAGLLEGLPRALRLSTQGI